VFSQITKPELFACGPLDLGSQSIMDGVSETSSVARSNTGSLISHRSASSMYGRAFLFSVRVFSVSYDPPSFPKDMLDLVTFGCGQLEKADKSEHQRKRFKPIAEKGEDSSDSSSDESETDDTTISMKDTPVHFKGYIEFNKQVYITAVRKWLESGDKVWDFHAEAAYLKDRAQHIRTRTNIDTRFHSALDLIARAPWQFGKSERDGAGARTDMEEIREILREHGPEEGVRLVAEKFPGQFIRYANGITQLAQAVVPRVREREDFVFRPWQAALVKILRGKAHPRHIFWVEDPRGGMGKSRLTTYLCREMNAVELDGRQMDAAFSYTGQNIVLFDLARAVDATTLKDLFIVGEKLKNGQIYSSKYQSRLKVFEVPHVVYFSNSPPPLGVWSADRLQHIQLSEPVPFAVGSHELEGEAPEPEVSGVDLFKQLLDGEKAARAKDKAAAAAGAGAGT